EDRDGVVRDLLDARARLVEHAAELEERHREQTDEQHERDGCDEAGHISQGHSSSSACHGALSGPARRAPRAGRRGVLADDARLRETLPAPGRGPASGTARRVDADESARIGAAPGRTNASLADEAGSEASGAGLSERSTRRRAGPRTARGPRRASG